MRLTLKTNLKYPSVKVDRNTIKQAHNTTTTQQQHNNNTTASDAKKKSWNHFLNRKENPQVTLQLIGRKRERGVRL